MRGANRNQFPFRRRLLPGGRFTSDAQGKLRVRLPFEEDAPLAVSRWRPGTGWLVTSLVLVVALTLLWNGWGALGVSAVLFAFFLVRDRRQPAYYNRALSCAMGLALSVLPIGVILLLQPSGCATAYPLPMIEAAWRSDIGREHMLPAALVDESLIGVGRQELLQRLGEPDQERHDDVRYDEWSVVSSVDVRVVLRATYDEWDRVLELERVLKPRGWPRG